MSNHRWVGVGKGVLLFVLLLAGLGSSVGLAATLTVGGVGSLGSGSAVVSSPPVEVIDVEWELDDDDPTLLEEVELTLRHTAGGEDDFDIYVTLKDSGGNVLGTEVEQDESITSDPEGTEVEFEFEDDDIPVSAITSIAVTVCFHVHGQPPGECR